MKLRNIGILFMIVTLLIGVGSFGGNKASAKKESLNQSYAYAYKTKDNVSWLKVTEKKGKVTGYLNGKGVKVDPIEPFMVKTKYKLTGKTTKKGYKLKVQQKKKTIVYDIYFSGKDLMVKKQGAKKSKRYQAVDEKKLKEYNKAIDKRYDEYVDTAEDRYYEIIGKYTDNLNKAYGYLYTAKNNSYQIFLDIEEAVFEGDFSGAITISKATGKKSKPLKKEKYQAVGTTGFKNFWVYPTPKIKCGLSKMIGSSDVEASYIELPIWKNNEKMKLKAVNKKQYQKQEEAFKNAAKKKAKKK
ncbi:hypothetical protein ACQKEX_11995 [Bacillus pumilus]|uniref:hypothetical protein n=1 Tax=Bacillus TaxID=1386 RepID=UPI0007EEE362|nr:hypothetical protein [Bacillus pumilus]MBU8575344.1 hypothetical protein [Bacillus pumilus]MBU8608349.1 hypothetical protein [Bacillus pumilus]MCW4681820.1 hypothetical protein [Bacillus pumilus]MCY7539128.1 hypothetical protein [Bacillus pumilus]MCY7575477.1 hypothetical protein [Bacillus pumilus]